MLRPITNTDFNFIYNLYMHPQVNSYLLYEYMSEAEFKPIFADLLAQQIVYIYEQNNEPVGMVKLIPETHRSSHVVYLGGFAVHPNFTGKGLGSILLQATIDYCQQQNFLRIVLSVSVYNEKAIALYKKLGFVTEGTLKNYTHFKSENKFIDEYLMAYLFN
jgi:L-phenylalanine/L-methionine N-acetyltransferase